MDACGFQYVPVETQHQTGIMQMIRIEVTSIRTKQDESIVSDLVVATSKGPHGGPHAVVQSILAYARFKLGMLCGAGESAPASKRGPADFSAAMSDGVHAPGAAIAGDANAC